MLTIRNLKILCVLAGLLWAGYWSANLLSYHITNHVPLSTGTLFCLLLFAAVPALAYILLFKLFPLASRLVKR
jgi:hypothetical protein